jgi:hypothetical protein
MIKLTKINVNPSSVVQHAESVKEYRDSLDNLFAGKSPPIDYVVFGELVQDIETGKSIILRRYCRPDESGQLVRVDGIMTTSLVVDIFDLEGVLYVTTRNSVYKVENVTNINGIPL